MVRPLHKSLCCYSSYHNTIQPRTTYTVAQRGVYTSMQRCLEIEQSFINCTQQHILITTAICLPWQQNTMIHLKHLHPKHLTEPRSARENTVRRMRWKWMTSLRLMISTCIPHQGLQNH